MLTKITKYIKLCHSKKENLKKQSPRISKRRWSNTRKPEKLELPSPSPRRKLRNNLLQSH